ncbi:YPDG domain-containing protein, partial [Staphylococcus felis]|uniref:YPDG domain-containing protein n=1 Tax=Staphylococcus felis TaxID=46127 RepID=UPI000E382B86
PVKVTYPDGSVDNTTTNVRVVPNDEQENTQEYNGESTKPGVGVNIPKIGDTQLPPNTRFENPQGGVQSGWTVTVNPNNGTVTATPPENAQPGTNVDIPVGVTYPCFLLANTTANVRDVPNDAQGNTPGYNGGSTKPVACVTILHIGDTQLPPMSLFQIPLVDVPSGSTVTVSLN